MAKWQRYRYYPVLPLGKDGKRVTECEEHINLSRQAASEGMVLLKNDNNLLPLKPENTVALFGKATCDYVKGGGGSGDVTVSYVSSLCDGIKEKQTENKVKLFSPLCDFYRNYVNEQYTLRIAPGKVDEPELPNELFEQAKAVCDVAIISICRYSKEAIDRNEEDDYYLTKAEKDLIKRVTTNFEKTVVVLNVGSVVDTSWFKDNPAINSVLLAWQGGMEGGKAEADILCGDVCPSAKLADTFASSYSDYPSAETFNESEDFVEYTDDIFVGYRYFSTIPNAKSKISYPFGFGLSYTSFSIETVSKKVNNNCIDLKIRVKNIGKTSGKEVVQIYVSAPEVNLAKPAFELKSFKKTRLLEPNESEELTFLIPFENLHSYDEKSASYILEKGLYKVYVGNSSENWQEVVSFNIDTKIITEKLSNRCMPKKLTKRLKSDGSYEALATQEYETLYDTSDWPKRPQWKFEHLQPDFRGTLIPEGRIMLDDVADGKASIDEFIAGLSTYDLIDILGGRPNQSVASTYGIGDLSPFGIPPVMTADGPAGLRIRPEIGISTTAFPCATSLACSWNTDLVYKIGKAAAMEVKENNFGMWLAPALNIHRNPLCGRNFEYYSEDPLLTGKIAAAMVKGIQSEKISACIKHFCCNNKEIGRGKSDSRVSERALREIYLKGFEIAVKESQPWAVMTAYNRLNGRFCSESKDLLEGILRSEWGFDGLILTDWVNGAEQYRELKAGNNLRMPLSHSHRMLKALEEGLIDRKDLEYNAKYILEFLLKLA